MWLAARGRTTTWGEGGRRRKHEPTHWALLLGSSPVAALADAALADDAFATTVLVTSSSAKHIRLARRELRLHLLGACRRLCCLSSRALSTFTRRVEAGRCDHRQRLEAHTIEEEAVGVSAKCERHLAIVGRVRD